MSEDEQDALLAKIEKTRRQRSLLFRAAIGAAIVAACIALALNSGGVAWHCRFARPSGCRGEPCCRTTTLAQKPLGVQGDRWIRLTENIRFDVGPSSTL